MFKLQICLKLVPVLAFLFTFFLLFKLLKMSGTIKKAQLIASCLFEVNFKLTQSLNAVSFLVLFYLIYSMIFKSILGNNIKSNSVIVDTSDLVEDKADLLSTKRKICFRENEFVFRMIRDASAGSYLKAVLERSKENNNGQLCTYGQRPFSFLANDIYNSVLFLNSLNIFGAGSILGDMIENQSVYFVNRFPFFSLVSALYFRKDIDPKFLEM